MAATRPAAMHCVSSSVGHRRRKTHRRSVAVDLRRLPALDSLRTWRVTPRPRLQRIPNRPKRLLPLRPPRRRPVDLWLNLGLNLHDRHPRARDARLKAAPQPRRPHRLSLEHLGRTLSVPFVPVLDYERRRVDEAERTHAAEGVEEGGRKEWGPVEGENEDGFGGGEKGVGLRGVELRVG